MVSAQVESRATEILATAEGSIISAYLFGSFGRGTSSPDSDVDVGILLKSEPSGTLEGLHLTLEGDLERALGRRVQVIVLNKAPADLVHRVLRDGRLLLDRDRAARIRFEVDARNRYFDLLPVLQAYRRQRVPS